MNGPDETTVIELHPQEETYPPPKRWYFGRFCLAWTFVCRDWWEFHVLPFFDITDYRIFAGWLFFTIQYKWRKEGGEE